MMRDGTKVLPKSTSRRAIHAYPVVTHSHKF
jgi:hypothetical protein